MNLSLIFIVRFCVMQFYIIHQTKMNVDTGLSRLLVRHQQIGPTMVQDTDVGVRPHKPKLHHGTALLWGLHPAWNLLLPSPMAVLILMHQGFTFKHSARWMILMMACPVCLSWKLLGNHDIFLNHNLLYSHHKLTLLFPQRRSVPYVTRATLNDVLCNAIISAK